MKASHVESNSWARAARMHVTIAAQLRDTESKGDLDRRIDRASMRVNAKHARRYALLSGMSLREIMRPKLLI